MKYRIAAALFFVAATALWAAQKIEPLNVKMGLWEMNNTITVTGTPVVPPEVLAKMPPEQRARLEERMKNYAGGQGRPHTYKSCFTKKKLEEGMGFDDQKQQCKRKVISSSSNHLEMEVECVVENAKTSGGGKIEVENPESVKGHMHMVIATPNGGNMQSDVLISGKWLGADCGDVQ
jgi:hypothetical protein